MSEKPYQPISCDIYDHLEIWALHSNPIEFQYEDQLIKGVIKNIQAEKGVEYLFINDLKIRLDEIDEISDGTKIIKLKDQICNL